MREYKLSNEIKQKFGEFLGLEYEYCMNLKGIGKLNITEKQYFEIVNNYEDKYEKFLKILDEESVFTLEQFKRMIIRKYPICINAEDIVELIKILTKQKYIIFYQSAITDHSELSIQDAILLEIINASECNSKLKQDIIQYWKKTR
jgi:hypothetical protein